MRVALVGGIVRDLLRGEKAGRDVDLLVEGDAAALARGVVRNAAAGPEAGSRPVLRIHERFGTATIEDDSGWKVDLAGARKERYPRPGALPEVEAATIEEDLGRRDFSVNALAWEPPPPRPKGRSGSGDGRGRLHDPFGGAADLAARRLRILHPRSFLDDPTRILRAVRYANRLGLRLERETRDLMKSALASGALATVSGDRLRREIAKIFSESGWEVAARRADAFGVLRAIHPSWQIDRRLLAALRRAESLAMRAPRTGVAGDGRRASAWMAALLVATSDLSKEDRRRIAQRLALAGDALRMFERGPADGEYRDGGDASQAPPTREEAIAWAALAPAGASRRLAEARLRTPARLSIRGADLIEAGVPAGPGVGAALRRTRRALEEGRIEAAEELEFAVAAARGEPERKPAGERRSK